MINNRITRKALAALATGAAAVGIAVVAPASHAATTTGRIPVSARGNTVIQLSGSVIRSLQNQGCGAVTAAPIGSGVVSSPGGNLQVSLPITGIAVDPDTAALRIAHSGSGVNLSNSCYNITFASFYIQNFGTPNQFMTFDVLARAKSEDDGPDRVLVFNLSLVNAQLAISGQALKVRSASVLLGDEGAEEFNELSTGGEGGPFSSGQQVGMARTTIRLLYTPLV